MTFFRETDYQTSPVGKVPSDWEVKKLTEVADYINGYGFSPNEWENSGLPIIRIQNLTNPTSDFNYFKGKIDDRYLVKNGDLLFAWSASIGCHLWDRGDAWLNQHIFKVVPKQGVDRKYLYYALFTAIEQLKQRVHGSTMQHFKRGELEKTFLPLPSENEQRAIVGVLGVVDSAIELSDQIIAKTERLKRGLMQQLLTRGIGHTATKQTPIGNIPKDWQVAPLGENVDFRNGINFNNEQRTSTGTLTIDVRNMYGEGIYVALEDLYRVNISDNEDCLLRKGDILFVRSSMKREGAGWASLFEGSSQPVTFCSFIIRARLKDQSQILPEFLAHYLRSDFARRKLVANAGQVAISNITQDSLSSLLFPIPPIEEQNKIAKILTTVDEKSKLEKIEKAKIERIKQALMDLLLTGKIRIKVD